MRATEVYEIRVSGGSSCARFSLNGEARTGLDGPYGPSTAFPTGPTTEEFWLASTALRPTALLVANGILLFCFYTASYFSSDSVVHLLISKTPRSATFNIITTTSVTARPLTASTGSADQTVDVRAGSSHRPNPGHTHPDAHTTDPANANYRMRAPTSRLLHCQPRRVSSCESGTPVYY